MGDHPEHGRVMARAEIAAPSRGVVGLSLIVVGLFSQDPTSGYPPGALVTAPTLHGAIPVMFSFVSITGIAVGDFVLAGASGRNPYWGRSWAVYSVMSGLLVGFIAVYGAMGPGLAGVFERLSTGANSLLSLLVLVRLLIQARGTAALDNAAMTAAVTAAP